MFTGQRFQGLDSKWKEQTIANTSEQQFKIEFECEFLGSVDTLISPSKLRNLVYDNPLLKIKDLMFIKNAKKIMIMS